MKFLVYDTKEHGRIVINLDEVAFCGRAVEGGRLILAGREDPLKVSPDIIEIVADAVQLRRDVRVVKE